MAVTRTTGGAGNDEDAGNGDVCVYAYVRVCLRVCVRVLVRRHTCCAVGPPPNSWPPRDEMPPPPQRGRRASIHEQRRFCHFTHHVSKSMAVEIPCQRLQMCAHKHRLVIQLAHKQRRREAATFGKRGNMWQHGNTAHH